MGSTRKDGIIVTWWLASLMANVAIATIEYLNRTAGYADYYVAIKHTWWLILIAQAGLFYCWKGAPSFMYAWGFFFAGNCAIRLVSNYFFVGEHINVIGYAGVALIMAGACLVKAGS